MKKNILFIVAAAAVLLVLFIISSRNEVPFIPADDQHKIITTNEACGDCHAPGKRAPLKEGHPPKEQCLVCHKAKKR